MPVSMPTISVVVPYYDAPGQLDLLLTALGRQTALGSFEVVVADDGSGRAASPPDGLPFSVHGRQAGRPGVPRRGRPQPRGGMRLRRRAALPRR